VPPSAGTIVKITLFPELVPFHRHFISALITFELEYRLPLMSDVAPVGIKVVSVAGPRNVNDGKAVAPVGRKGSQTEFNFTAPPVMAAVATGTL